MPLLLMIKKFSKKSKIFSKICPIFLFSIVVYSERLKFKKTGGKLKWEINF